MKRFWTFLLALAAFAACNPVDKEEAPTLNVSPAEPNFSGEDSSFRPIAITTNGNWTATPADDWVQLDKTSGTGNSSITVTAAPNGQNSARTSSIQIQAQKGGKTLSASVTVNQASSEKIAIVPAPKLSGEDCASTTYQLLVYTFADSDGDGIGDFKGIQNKLDYLKGMGITGLWLSPVHPSDSYHGYDVTDYFTVNPKFGTEADFKALLDAAHAKGIKIYLDYVLNHSGKGHPWFQEALANASSPYRDYYFFSSNPSTDYRNFPMLAGTTYQSGEWKSVTSGSPKLTVTKTSEAVTNGSASWNLYMWQDGAGDKTVKFVDKGDGTFYLVMDINGKWGMLVRKYLNWDAGSKFGAKSGNTTLTEGKPLDLVAEGADISFTGSGRYRIELSNVTTETLYYMGCFSDWMPDLNYGKPSEVASNACFQDMAASADKWINMGVDGFRLDAVKHICGGIGSYNHSANRTLLKTWYERCNSTYKAAGHSDNIFMVAEEWDGHGTEKTYYQSLTSCFEFEYWRNLRGAVSGSGTGSYVTTVMGFINDHKAQRPDAITSLFMTNHDKSSITLEGQGRAANDLGKDLEKEKQAAAMMLTTGGKPFVYQGEELGYWGDAHSGDEYIRAPILWDKAGKECAKKGVNNKVDNSMLKAEISVEAQDADASSLLNVYKTWGSLRNGYKALGEGEMSTCSITAPQVAAWYMTSGSEKMLVIHNCGSQEKTLTVEDDMSQPVALLGGAWYQEKELTLAAHSSVVFKVQ